MLWPELKESTRFWNLDHMKRRVTRKQTLTTVFTGRNMGRDLIGWLERESVWPVVVAFRTDRNGGPEQQQMVLVTHRI